MSENAEPDWKAITRKRWPLFKIGGEGPFVAFPRGEGIRAGTQHARAAQFGVSDPPPA
jgi:hypothetical protein